MFKLRKSSESLIPPPIEEPADEGVIRGVLQAVVFSRLLKALSFQLAENERWL
ncbi:MAG: hypothetical protein ONB46_20490 [candidate division KSB1 bacterium]|nr:hypothetical protein [candidate division KSB1 bacterium]